MSKIVSFADRRAAVRPALEPAETDMSLFLGHFLHVDDVSVEKLTGHATQETVRQPKPVKQLTMQARHMSLHLALGRSAAS